MDLKVAGLTPKEWRAANRDERLSALQELENQLSDIQQRHTCTIQTYPGHPLECGYYSARDPEHINLNEALLTGNSLKDAVETIAHEGRHAYQDHCICYPDEHPELDPAVIDTWRDNFANYVPPDIDDALYRNQPIEADAFTYEAFVSRTLNIPTQARMSMQEPQRADEGQSASRRQPPPARDEGPGPGLGRRQPPPAREDGPTFVSPSREALDRSRLDFYGDPVKLNQEQFPKQPAQDAAARETIALPKNYVQALLNEKNEGNAKANATDDYTLLVKGESVAVMDGAVELSYHEPTGQYIVKCDKDQEKALQKHLGELFSKQQPAERVQRQAPSRDFERE